MYMYDVMFVLGVTVLGYYIPDLLCCISGGEVLFKRYDSVLTAIGCDLIAAAIIWGGY